MCVCVCVRVCVSTAGCIVRRVPRVGRVSMPTDTSFDGDYLSTLLNCRVYLHTPVVTIPRCHNANTVMIHGMPASSH